MKRSIALALAATLALSAASAQGFLLPRNYDWAPPPYEISLWGTGGLLFGAEADPTFAQGSPDLLRLSWGFDFMFRFWILGLGLEYSNQALENIKLNPDSLAVETGYKITQAYLSRFADAVQLKAKVEIFNIVGEAGIGFYIPRTALYQDLTKTIDNTTEKWSKTSTQALEPSMIISFGAGYPLWLSHKMDLMPFARYNLFTLANAISIKTVQDIATYKPTSTIDLGLRLRVAYD